MNFRNSSIQPFPCQFYKQPTLKEVNKGSSFQSNNLSGCCFLQYYDVENESKQTNNTFLIDVPSFDTELLPDLMRAIDSIGDMTDKPIFSETTLPTLEQNRVFPCFKSDSATPSLEISSRVTLPLFASNNSANPLKSMKNAEWDFFATSKPDTTEIQMSTHQSGKIPIPNNGKNTLHNTRVLLDLSRPKPEVATKRTPTWQELSSQINKFAHENAINAGWDVFVSKKQSPKDSTLYDISVQEPKMFIKVRNAYKRSFKSQKRLEEWDKKMGLKRCHSRTMIKSSLTRKQLLDSMNDIQMQCKRDVEKSSS